MSTTEPFPTPAPQSTPRPRRLRRFIFASALLVTGGMIGAVIAGPVLGQGPGFGGHGFGPPWHHHMGGSDRMFFPGPIERGVERLGWITDASTEQKTKINAI